MDALLVSTLAVAIAEIGDKTQLLAIVLAARFRKPLPIVLGILVATLLNHAVAASFGYLIAQWLTGHTFQIVLGVAFIAMAAWALIPDKEDEGAGERSSGGVFLTTLIAFFLVEIGDKTQVATVVLAAQYEPLWQVIAGTTLGMAAANVPVVLLGSRFAAKLPLKAARWRFAMRSPAGGCRGRASSMPKNSPGMGPPSATAPRSWWPSTSTTGTGRTAAA